MQFTAPTLYQFQDLTMQDLRNSLRNGFKAPLVVSPTGSGKTTMFCYMAASAIAKGKRVLILVHRIELLTQTSKTLRNFGVNHGLINPNFTPNLKAPVQVAMVQTLIKRLDYADKLGINMVIVDEAHHANSPTYATIGDAFTAKGAVKIGFTATPIRTDGTGLGDSFDDMVIGASVSELIASGKLVQPTLFVPPASFTGLDGIAKRGGDYSKKPLEELMNKPSVTGNALDYYREFCVGVPSVAFCTSVKHAESVAAQFREIGVNAKAVDGETDYNERKAILDGLGNGNTEVVCSCDLISEGTDIPAIGGMFLLRPTMSLSLYLQQVGRGLRPSSGKSECKIFDHVGNSYKMLHGEFVAKHGSPEDEREWSLEGDGKDKSTSTGSESVVNTKQCTSCYVVFKSAPKCPSCGAEVKTKAREIRHTEGELMQLTKEMQTQAKEQAEKQKQAAAMQRKNEVWNCKSITQLQDYALKNNYSPAWAKKIWASRQQKAAKKL